MICSGRQGTKRSIWGVSWGVLFFSVINSVGHSISWWLRKDNISTSCCLLFEKITGRPPQWMDGLLHLLQVSSEILAPIRTSQMWQQFSGHHTWHDNSQHVRGKVSRKWCRSCWIYLRYLSLSFAVSGCRHRNKQVTIRTPVSTADRPVAPVVNSRHMGQLNNVFQLFALTFVIVCK